MKIVSEAVLYTLPANVVFCSYIPHRMGLFLVKGESYINARGEGTFPTVELLSQFTVPDDLEGEFEEYVEELCRTGQSVSLEFHDQPCNIDGGVQYYLVFERADVTKLVTKLTQLLFAYPDISSVAGAKH